MTAIALLTSSGHAAAQTMKPGLWEITSQMQGGGGEMAGAMAKAQKEMANMPPEQRKMIQDMMAKQGVQMAPGGGSDMRIKVCLTQEMVARNEVATSKGDCTNSYSQRSGNAMTFSFVCTKPPSRGDGTITFSGSDAYNVQMTNTTVVKGKSEKIDMQSNGRWLGQDCGNIKPITSPAR
jgi:hypothetical protein